MHRYPYYKFYSLQSFVSQILFPMHQFLFPLFPSSSFSSKCCLVLCSFFSFLPSLHSLLSVSRILDSSPSSLLLSSPTSCLCYSFLSFFPCRHPTCIPPLASLPPFFPSSYSYFPYLFFLPLHFSPLPNTLLPFLTPPSSSSSSSYSPASWSFSSLFLP